MCLGAGQVRRDKPAPVLIRSAGSPPADSTRLTHSFAMMGSDEAMMGSDDVREENSSSLLQSLEKEVVALRQSESGLIAELQRRCDKMIELEVNWLGAIEDHTGKLAVERSFCRV